MHWSDQIGSALNTSVHAAIHKDEDRQEWRKIIKEKLLEEAMTLSIEDYRRKRDIKN